MTRTHASGFLGVMLYQLTEAAQLAEFEITYMYMYMYTNQGKAK